MGRLSFKHCYKKLLHYNFVCDTHLYHRGFHSHFFKKDDITVISYMQAGNVLSLSCIINGIDIAFTDGSQNKTSFWPTYMFSSIKFEHFLDAVCIGKNKEVIEAFRKREMENTLNIL